MRIINQWLEQWHFRQLRKTLQQSKPLRLPVSYPNSKKIAILFNAADSGSLKIVQQFEQALRKKNKSVKVLAYCQNKLLQENYPYATFGKKEVGLTFKPKGRKVEKFIETPFDILFNLYHKENLMLGYISACSKAHFRIGPVNKNSFYYDLMIEMPEGKDLTYFIAQAEKILKNVNNDQHATTL